MHTNLQKDIPTQVKSDDLVRRKRRALAKAAVKLFIRKGFHKTTTREIARAAGWSVGAVYEYVAAKEDILYLVCEAIHGAMEEALRPELDHGATAREALAHALEAYIRTCDQMQDSILLIYQETASLTHESRQYVLRNEERITNLFAELLRRGAADGSLRLADDRAAELMAHTIMVVGHMWAFRRWHWKERVALEEYIAEQSRLVLNTLTPGGPADES